MKVLEFMDFDMLDVVNRGPIASIHQSSNNGASSNKLKGKCVPYYKKEVKRMLNLDVKSRIAIGNSLPFSIYRLVQNYLTTKEMMTTISSTFQKEHSSYDEAKCLMAQLFESQIDTTHDSVGILKGDSSHTVDDLKSAWDDTSAYQEKVMLIFPLLIISKKMT